MNLPAAIIVPSVLFLGTSFAWGAGLTPLKVTPPVSAVTVYPDRAMTTRTAELALVPGSYLVTFDNLPALVQDDSIRVDGRGSAAAAIAGIEVKKVFLDRSGEQQIREIDDGIRELERQSAVLDAKKSGLTAQKTFLDSIRVAWGERISRELAIGRPATAELQEAAVMVGSGVTRAEEQSHDIEQEKRRIREKIDALLRQRNQAAGSRARELKQVVVQLEVSREGNLALELSAVSPQASWEPVYDVRLAPDGTTADMTFRGVVRQQTGEPWQNATLTLSTARPAVGGAPPELPPWRVSLVRPLPPVPAPAAAGSYLPRMEMLAARSLKAAQAADMSAPEEPVTNLTSAVISEEASVSFRVPRTVDIPSDSSPHGTVVAAESLPVTLEYLAVPKLAPSVYLRSEIINRASYPLLPGKVNTFTGSTFTGSSYLNKVAAGEKFELFFGADDRITVKREEVKQHRGAGLFGDNRMEYRYRIEAASYRTAPVTLTLRDQLPLAGDAEIRVSLDTPALKADEVRDDGRITWKLPLSPGEKRELTYGILVEYPKERSVNGL